MNNFEHRVLRIEPINTAVQRCAVSISNKGTYLLVLDALDDKTSLAYHGANIEERSQ